MFDERRESCAERFGCQPKKSKVVQNQKKTNDCNAAVALPRGYIKCFLVSEATRIDIGR